MKCQILFSRKNKKSISKCRLLKFLPSMQSVNGNYGNISPVSVPCKYKKKKWGPCNPHTKTVSRLLMLRKGNIGDCQATKVISRPCRKNKRKKSKTKKKTKGKIIVIKVIIIKIFFSRK